jgi:RND superfamily putative drug exporter
VPSWLTRLATGRRSRWAVIGAWVLVALALVPLQGKLQELAADESGAFEGRSAESTRAGDLIDDRFSEGSQVTAAVLYTREGGLLPEDRPRMAADAESLCASKAIRDLDRVITPDALACGDLGQNLGPATPTIGSVSQDATSAIMTVQTTDDATDSVVRVVEAIRAVVPGPDGDGLRAYVTGQAGFAADQSLALEGIDGTLMAITGVLVLLLLLALYRSPVMAVVPLIVVSLAYVVAAAIVYGLATAGAFRATGQATAILVVLMFGAGTDYCLLLVSRYREELGGGADAEAAMRRAVSRGGPAILSAGGTVVAAMLVLALADYKATQWMGPVLAVGVAVTVLAGLTLLPALVLTLGRRAFWPATPATTAPPVGPSAWRRVGELVARRAWLVTAIVLAVLVAGALGNLGGRGTLDFAEAFRSAPESVQGQQIIRAKYPPGQSAPLSVVTTAQASGAMVERLQNTSGIAAAETVSNADDGKLTLLSVVLEDDPFSDRATAFVPELRGIVRDAAAGDEALVGGIVAENHDARETLAADAKLIVPVTLALLLLIVAALVRAVVAPLYLIGTVVLSYAFALGASSLLFTHVLDQPDSDPTLPLFAFIFLVALGVDYNIFLVSRIREAAAERGTRAAVITGVEKTGSVITSAGLILAGTFGALMALELESLFQVGFTVALGLLVDTFLVRVFLVPGIAVLLGERNWWPRRARPTGCAEPDAGAGRKQAIA